MKKTRVYYSFLLLLICMCFSMISLKSIASGDTGDQKSKISKVTVVIPEPEVGKTPVLKAETKDSVYKAVLVSYNNENGEELTVNDKFEAGREYTANIEIEAAPGYAFSVEPESIGEFWNNSSINGRQLSSFSFSEDGTFAILQVVFTMSAQETEKSTEAPENEKETEKPEINVPKKDTILTDTKTKSQYKVVKAGMKNGTVVFYSPKNKKVKKVVIPASVKIDGITYKVVGIAKNACKKCTELKSLTIGKNVASIGSAAFYKCSKLKKITIQTTKLTNKNVGAKAFKGTHKEVIVKVPKKKVAAYRVLLIKKGLLKKAVIS